MTIKKYFALGFVLIYISINSRAYAGTFDKINDAINSVKENATELKVYTNDVVYKLNTNKKVVALTFDDGPDPKYTPKILKILKENNINATFFVVGQNAKKYPSIVNQAIKDGNEIENHTYTHPHAEDLKDNLMISEIVKDNSILSSEFNITPKFFRPPRGVCRGTIIETILRKYHMPTILWTICFEHKKTPNPYKRADEIINSVKPGYIILAHDGRLNRSKTVTGISYVIKGLKKKGYTFVTLNQIIK